MFPRMQRCYPVLGQVLRDVLVTFPHSSTALDTFSTLQHCTGLGSQCPSPDVNNPLQLRGAKLARNLEEDKRATTKMQKRP